MKNNNVVIFLGIVLTILIIALIYVVNERNTPKVIIMPGGIYEVTSNSFVKYNKDVTKKTKLNIKDNSISNLTFTYVKGELKFYSGKKEIEVPDDFGYAYTSRVNVDNIDISKEELDMNELSSVNDILKTHGIEGYDYLTTSKVTIDNKTIYFVSNLFEEYTYSKVFSFVYYFNEESDIIYLIEEVKSSDNIYDMCLPTMNSYIKVNGVNNIIIDCDYYSEIGTDKYIYKVDKELTKVN